MLFMHTVSFLGCIAVLRPWMRYVVTDGVGWSDCQSVMIINPVKTTELGYRVWWVWGSIIRWDAHLRHLANTIKPSMCGGDAAFLSDYFD